MLNGVRVAENSSKVKLTADPPGTEEYSITTPSRTGCEYNDVMKLGLLQLLATYLLGEVGRECCVA